MLHKIKIKLAYFIRKVYAPAVISILPIHSAWAFHADTDPSATPIPHSGQSQIDSLIGDVLRILNTYVLGLLLVIATLVFLWGVVSFIASAGDAAKRDKAKAIMTWGILGLAVMVAAWGIATLIANYFVPGSGRNIIPSRPGDI